MEQNANQGAVYSLQYMLDRLAQHDPALLRLTTDGKFGENTLEAVMRFQRSNRLPVTGVVDQALWDIITAAYRASRFQNDAPPPLDVFARTHFDIPTGQTRDPMLIVQAVFISLAKVADNFDHCEVDGTNAGHTTQDIQAFQRLSGLPATGALDRPTWAMLATLYRTVITRNCWKRDMT